MLPAASSSASANAPSVAITAHRLDFIHDPWPFGPVDGILMANALHYVADQPPFIAACVRRLTSGGRFLIVEYDTAIAIAGCRTR